MPLFRFHRGSLEDSLKTTIIVKTFNDMVKAIVTSELVKHDGSQNWGAAFKVTPYGFDSRTGWYTQLVTCNIYEEDEMYPVGFLSEPFGDNNE